MSELRAKFEQNLGWIILALLLGGCLLRLQPFASGLIWAVVLSSSIWLLYNRLLNLVGRPTHESHSYTKPMSCRLSPVARSIQKHFIGNVSKTALLTRLLPLSFASLFSALIAAALFFPTGYDWQVRVISTGIFEPR